MADVRALLRQQRAARRIIHPYATYSETGKLLCTLCRDQIRAEAHWDAHLLSDKHKKRLSAVSRSTNVKVNDDDRVDDENKENDENKEKDENERGGVDVEDHDALAAQKRKLDQIASEEKDTDVDDEDEARRKRSRPEAGSFKSGPEEGGINRKQPLVPSQGAQVQMPSQPAVPKLTTSLPSRQASNLATPASSSSMSISLEPHSSNVELSHQQSQQQPPQPTSHDQQVDEDEWAAFEAEIAATAAAQVYDDDAVISRPAMTAEEAAAAKEAEEQAILEPESRKSKVDVDLEDEREEATRALEDEFEEMQELEARVQRLKEKRDALMRRRSETLSQGQAAAEADHFRTTTKLASEQDEGKENVQATETEDSTKAETDDDDDDDEEEEEDDWDGFRFRTGR